MPKDERGLSLRFIKSFKGVITNEGIEVNHASFRLVPHHVLSNQVELYNVKVDKDHRFKGYGSRVMLMVAKFLDMEQLICKVTVEPYDNNPMSQPGLKKWYRKFGFVSIKGMKFVMIRKISY